MAISNVQYNIGEGTFNYTTDAAQDDGPVFRLTGGGLTVAIQKDMTGTGTEVQVVLWSSYSATSVFVAATGEAALSIGGSNQATRSASVLTRHEEFVPPGWYRFETTTFGSAANFSATIYVMAEPGRLLRVVE